MLPGEVNGDAVAEIHENVAFATQNPEYVAVSAIYVGDAMRIPRRYQVIPKFVLLDAVQVEPVERVFVISCMPDIVVCIIQSDVFGRAPFKDDISGVDRYLLKHAVPYPVSIGVVRVVCGVESPPARHVVLVLLVNGDERCSL